MTRKSAPSNPPRDDPPVDEIAENIANANPDTTTRREALEQELESLGRSEEGEEVGDQIE